MTINMRIKDLRDRMVAANGETGEGMPSAFELVDMLASYFGNSIFGPYAIEYILEQVPGAHRFWDYDMDYWNLCLCYLNILSAESEFNDKPCTSFRHMVYASAVFSIAQDMGKELLGGEQSNQLSS